MPSSWQHVGELQLTRRFAANHLVHAATGSPDESGAVCGRLDSVSSRAANTMGLACAAFEAALAEFCGASFCVGVSSSMNVCVWQCGPPASALATR